MTTQIPPLSTTATGRRDVRHGVEHVAFDRIFRAPVEAVWAAVTEADRMERWIGTWSGDPREGFVDFRMTAEGDDVPVERYTVEQCEPPHRLVVRSAAHGEDAGWLLTLDLTEDAGVTTLVFAQAVADPALASSVGPGWDYYLDRLVLAAAGAAVDAIVWSDYEGRSEHYRALFS